MQTYEALLSYQKAVQQVRAAQREIKRLGGTVKIAPPTTTGLVFVTLTLPNDVTPEQILPGLPFYAV